MASAVVSVANEADGTVSERAGLEEVRRELSSVSVQI